jgi:alpha-L-arabinofuranosidase
LIYIYIYIGIKVQAGWQYNGSFYVKSPDYTGTVTVALQSLDSSAKVYATATPVKKVNSTWTKYTYTFSPTVSAPDANNQFVVELDGSQGSGATVYFGLFTLFPPTYKGRPNGLRIDLAEAIAASQPGVWRFGGNNLVGNSIANRFIWNGT